VEPGREENRSDLPSSGEGKNLWPAELRRKGKGLVPPWCEHTRVRAVPREGRKRSFDVQKNLCREKWPEYLLFMILGEGVLDDESRAYAERVPLLQALSLRPQIGAGKKWMPLKRLHLTAIKICGPWHKCSHGNLSSWVRREMGLQMRGQKLLPQDPFTLCGEGETLLAFERRGKRERAWFFYY